MTFLTNLFMELIIILFMEFLNNMNWWCFDAKIFRIKFWIWIQKVPLHLAVEKGNTEWVDLLLSNNKTNPNIKMIWKKSIFVYKIHKKFFQWHY